MSKKTVLQSVKDSCSSGMAVLLKQVRNKPGALAIKFTHFSLRGGGPWVIKPVYPIEKPHQYGSTSEAMANYPEALA
ncbi:hypothetical protein EV210_105212 [Anaerospora hongkongensis]|uniref:Uncharacterized protein n=1 Tax=Anaerospora hongkongensis TaxID=244830 RepID=A0A4R1Q0V6_9FIRM|nr:hypothetical protein [Anaerospora hongkongensis]TCL37776.1 hypothetical protein EV210_105212 [Anaerospora hongkongensis]